MSQYTEGKMRSWYTSWYLAQVHRYNSTHGIEEEEEEEEEEERG